MSQKNLLDNFIFNIRENRRRKYIWNELNDYEEYIKREKEAFKNTTSQYNKQVIISNISVVYSEIGEYDKAIETIKLLDNYELNDLLTFIYYSNLLSFYILNNDEENADVIYDECQWIMKKLSEKYPDNVDINKIRYLNFKGKYEESLEILKQNRIKDKNTDYMKLILADIAFNTDKFHEGVLIISEMCKEYNKKNPCIRKQIDTLINLYMRNISVEKNELPEPITLDKKIWLKVKDSNFKTSLFFTYLNLKKICKMKWVKYAAIPTLITAFLCRIFFPLVYGNRFSEVFRDIIAFLFLIYFICGFGYLAIKYTKKIKNGLLSAIIITVMVINILTAFFLLDFKGNILDLKYAITKTAVEESGPIEKIKVNERKNSAVMELRVKNKIFIIYDYDEFFDYINENFKKGEKVNIEFLPNSKKLINIEKSSN